MASVWVPPPPYLPWPQTNNESGTIPGTPTSHGYPIQAACLHGGNASYVQDCGKDVYLREPLPCNMQGKYSQDMDPPPPPPRSPHNTSGGPAHMSLNFRLYQRCLNQTWHVGTVQGLEGSFCAFLTPTNAGTGLVRPPGGGVTSPGSGTAACQRPPAARSCRCCPS